MTVPSSLGVLDADLEPPLQALAAVWGAYDKQRDDGVDPFTATVRVAARVDRLGFAFAVGYPAALQTLIPGIGHASALCVTEADGNSPRAIQTTLVEDGDRAVLTGTKSFVTFGSQAETLVVVARVGEKADGRPDLAVVRVPAARRGIVLQALPETPFVPEVPHNSVRFEGVEVRPEERLQGDGYLNYVKPFRTVEDIHVIAATLAYLLGLAKRNHAGPELCAEAAASLVTLEGIRAAAPLDPRVHVVLQGVYRQLAALLGGSAFRELLSMADKEEAARWERDQALLRVASKAREARFDRAVQQLAGG